VIVVVLVQSPRLHRFARGLFAARRPDGGGPSAPPPTPPTTTEPTKAEAVR
jgi:hypothetical protein